MLTDKQRRLCQKNDILDKIYAERVSQLIRERYSLNDELAILRQKDSSAEKAAEFEAYTLYAEECKIKARQEIYVG